MGMQLTEFGWKLKIAALLHDPVVKPFTLLLGENHAVVAKDMMDKLGLADIRIEDTSLAWLVMCHHPKKTPKEYRESCQKTEKSLPLLKAIIEADRNSSAADRIPTEDIYIHEVYPIHPLSGERLQALKIARNDYLKIREDIVNFLSEKLKENGILSERFLENPKLLYLILWRFLPEALKKGLENVPLTFINMNLPADTRVPTHTIWDHLRTTSALVTCFKEGKLNVSFLRFELGGVQEFLCKARTTADYWAGSWITSILMFSIIRNVVDSIGPDAIIYPDVHGIPLVDLWLCKGVKIGLPRPSDEDILTPVIPEAVLIIVPREKIASLKDECKKALNETWETLSDEVREHLKKLLKGVQDWSKFDETWDRQTSEPPFIFRITQVDWPGDINEARSWLDNTKRLEKEGVSILTNNVKGFLTKAWEASEKKGIDYVKPSLLYSGLYEELQAKIHASEMIRHFEIPTEPSEGFRKRCNLCGVRNPVWNPDDHNFWRPLEKVGLIDFNERLCSVCLIKRVLGGAGKKEAKEVSKELKESILETLCGEGAGLRKKEVEPYPSTSDIATANFKMGVLILWRDIRDKILRRLEDFMNEFASYSYHITGEVRYKEPIVIPKLKNGFEKLKNELKENEREILGWFLGLTGEYLFEETYDREVKRMEYELDRIKKEKLSQDDIKKFEERIRKVKSGPLERVKNALNEFLRSYEKVLNSHSVKEKIRKYEKAIVSKPNDTLVVMSMDGDFMGRWISGANNPTVRESLHEDVLIMIQKKSDEEFINERRAQSPANHAFISRTLSTFALKLVRWIIEGKYCGRVVYAGGDDVVALLPPEDAFEIAMKLREEYSREWGAIDEGGKPLAVLGMGHKATSSIALVCIHYMYPLSRAIEISRTLLKEAKEYEVGWEKDAVCVALYSRAGEIAKSRRPLHLLYPNPRKYPIFVNGKTWQGVSVLRNTNRLSWLLSSGEGKGHRSPLVDALELSQLIKGKWKKIDLSRRLLYELFNEARLLKGLPADAIKAELKRLIKRHLKVRGENKETLYKRLTDRLTGVLIYWYNEGCLEDLVMCAKIADSLLGDLVYG